MPGHPPAAVLLMFVALMFGGTASGSDDAQRDLPTFFFDWAEVHAADAPRIVTLQEGPLGTCSARIQSTISIGPDESGFKSLVLEPVAGQDCAYHVRALMREGMDAELYRLRSDAAMQAAELSCALGLDSCTHEAQGPPDPFVNPDDEGSNADVEARIFCRIADGWAHTGVPDPPTVVYTRVYQDTKICWDSNNAWIEELGGVCFANSGTEWATDPDECYFSDWNTGPAATVYITIHGYFEKTNEPPGFRPFHDMWNTVHGQGGNGAVYCTGDIVGDYDGYVTVDNCGATDPQPQ